MVQIFASCSENEAYVIDRYSSHPTENFIGIIRKLCDGDNGYEVIAYNLVRYEFISRNSDYVFVKPKAKLLNKGVCSLRKDWVNFVFSKTPLELSTSGFFNFYTYQKIIQFLSIFPEKKFFSLGQIYHKDLYIWLLGYSKSLSQLFCYLGFELINYFIW